jgi:ubiquinone/menaquinone biosynthesis C-methylase UbiE
MMEKDQFYFDKKNERIIDFLDLRKTDKILIIGTGIEPFMEFFLLNKGVKKVSSVDIDRKNLKNGGKKLPDIDFRFGDVTKKLPYGKNSFDKVVITEVLHYFEDEISVMKEISRVLKKGGFVVLSAPSKRTINILNPVVSIQKNKSYSHSEIDLILRKSGFELEKIFFGGDIYDLLNLWTHLFFKYFLRRNHPNPFQIFKKGIDRSWIPSFSGKGITFLAKAKKN